ncbi:MAG: Uma2 family endonuclease [Acidobacteriaceae bacterium]|nr:Uma2 family endonuclease [Acidobacteriaceae bacterium]
MSTTPHGTTTIEQYLSYEPPPHTTDELIEGKIILSPCPMPEHADLCTRLYDLLKPLLEDSQFMVRQDTSVRLPLSQSMPRPEVFVIDRERWRTARGSRTYPTGSPQLVIEVFSPSNQNEEFRKKPELYLAADACAVWIVHPSDRSVEVRDHTGIRFLGGSERLALPPPLPPGSFAVDQIFVVD